ncbi:MAG TPA: SAM-dependent methyltransferase [Myxococcota bacterium]
MDERGTIHDVADTAFLVAAFRAQESDRTDALFSDPFAARLVGERRQAILATVAHLGEMAGWSSVVRTVLIDRLIADAVEHGFRTVINIGAGLDTRPYRLELPPSLSWIEADQVGVVAHKNAVLAGETPRCSLSRVAVDLADANARRALLARIADAPALGIIEGVFPYLTDDAVGATLDDLFACEAIEQIIVDYIPPEIIRARAVAGSRLHDVPFRFMPPDWHAFFAEHGWRVKAMHDLAEEGARRGRPFPIPEALRAQMTQQQPPAKPSGTFAAYAVMERDSSRQLTSSPRSSSPQQ